MIDELFNRSIEIIKANQTSSGAYLASPDFPVYNYCWFRDGTYIAYAMDLVGEHDSALRFYNWAAATIAKRADRVERALKAVAHGDALSPEDLLDTRYTVNGTEDDSDWPNFQLDGFGTLLWGMSEHLGLTGHSLKDMPAKWGEAVVLLARYLGALWSIPCYDCWEEFGDKVHTATLASLYGGLQAAAGMLTDAEQDASKGEDAHAASSAASLIKRFVLDKCVSNGTLCKFVGNDAVDASLFHVSVPYGLLSPDDPVIVKTVERIDAELRGGKDSAHGAHKEGVHRYADDSYYGGGEWVLLTAYLGWYYSTRGETAISQQIVEWVKGCADEGGALPEQVACHLNHPEMLGVWEERWGPVAKPLLWSHAAYLTLAVMSGNGFYAS